MSSSSAVALDPRIAVLSLTTCRGVSDAARVYSSVIAPSYANSIALHLRWYTSTRTAVARSHTVIKRERFEIRSCMRARRDASMGLIDIGDSDSISKSPQEVKDGDEECDF